jgi:hypothetical protein
MTLPNSSPRSEEELKSGFARLTENLRSIDHPDAKVLADRCERLTDGIPPRSDEVEQEHREKVDYGMRMARQRNDLLAVLFSPEEDRRAMFDWLCAHSDVPELYRNDYAKV